MIPSDRYGSTHDPVDLFRNPIPPVRASFIVEVPGPLTTVQDGGRPGLARYGVSRGGAADRGSWRLANRLMGNREDAPALEITAGSFAALALIDNAVAVTGAEGEMRLMGREEDRNTVLFWRQGTRLELAAPSAGLRSYLAIRGGLVGPEVLGSTSWHTLARLGPAPIAPGEVVSRGSEIVDDTIIDHVPVASLADDVVELAAGWGPRADHFTGEALERIATAHWRVSDKLDRSGVRMTGPRLVRRPPAGELPSEGVVRGAVQVPPSGLPIIFLADHPATGGYPVVAVLTEAAADRAAQLRPGERVRLRMPLTVVGHGPVPWRRPDGGTMTR